jgi:hypothetical protein
MTVKKLTALLLFSAGLLTVAGSARGGLVSFSASGTISSNSTTDPTIPVGTPWSFVLVYNDAAPDLDFELTGTPDPSFGRFTNGGAIPALTFFQYRAGSYDVTLSQPSDFGPFSAVEVTFSAGVHAIDINLNAAGLFPPLAGGAVSFHADFNDASHSAFASDALPANPALGLQNFQGSSVTLLPPQGAIVGSRGDMSGLAIAPVPEPAMSGLAAAGLLAFLQRARRRQRA